MIPTDLDALERLLAKATRGEWGVTRRGGAPTISIVDAEGNPAPRTGMRPCGDAYPTIARLPADYSTDDANAALIASAVNALPALIAAARERDELAAQLLATQQDRHRILMERDKLEAVVLRLRLSLNDATTECREAEAERDALRTEVERMRAVVKAARDFKSVCEDWVQCDDWESYVALRRALSALDAAYETND